MTRLVGLDLVGSSEPWARLGLEVNEDDSITVGEVTLRFGFETPALRVWTPADDGDAPSDLDGVAVLPGEPLEPAPVDRHVLGAGLVDHIVLMTPSLGRTVAAATSVLRLPLKRERDAGNGVRQGFFRLGEVILEIVESPHIPQGPAQFWGLVLIVDDLVEQCERLGDDVVSLPKAAVQKGRFISTVRSAGGLGCPVALMSG
jgi:hypothetical protein